MRDPQGIEKEQETEASSEAEPEIGTGRDTSGREVSDKSREVGGQKGPEPTRFGDWERAGRCIDF
jgi:hypothetical protein